MFVQCVFVQRALSVLVQRAFIQHTFSVLVQHVFIQRAFSVLVQRECVCSACVLSATHVINFRSVCSFSNKYNLKCNHHKHQPDRLRSQQNSTKTTIPPPKPLGSKHPKKHHQSHQSLKPTELQKSVVAMFSDVTAAAANGGGG